MIGGGYIGLETAAALTKGRKQGVLLAALDRLLPRVAGKELSCLSEAEHRSHNVDVRVGAEVGHILGEQRVTGVRLADGEVLNAQMVIVGIGIVPAVEPLLAAGATSGNGVVINGQCRTTLPHVLALGGCALHENRFAGGAVILLESAQNTTIRLQIVAKAINEKNVKYKVIL